MAKILYLISPEGFQDHEFEIPFNMLKEKNHEVTIASTIKGECVGKFSLKVNSEISVN